MRAKRAGKGLDGATRRRYLHCRRLCLTLICCAVLLGGCGQPGNQDGLDDSAINANNRGVGLMGRYDYETAHGIFQELSEQYPQQPDITVNLAIALMNRQQDDDEAQALKLFQAVLPIVDL